MLDPTALGFELTGAIRIVPNKDCLGIPLFSRHPCNSSFVPETDDGLGITEFNVFDSDDLQIEPVAPTSRSIPQHYQVGDPVPIPVWIDDRQQIVLANRKSDVVIDELGSDHAVVLRLGRVLARAQAHDRGEFVRNEWEALRAFLQERPTADRYWVGRFRDLLSQVEILDRPKRDYALRELANVATLWAKDCAAKAHTKVVRKFLETLMSIELNKGDFLNAESFAMLSHVLAKPSTSRSMSKELDSFIQKVDTTSLMDYLRSSPLSADEQLQTSFEKLSRSLRAALIHGRASEIENYTKLFGYSSFLPVQVEEIGHLVANFKHSELANLATMVLSSDSEHSSYMRQLYAAQGIQTARLLEVVYRLLYADQRNKDLYETKLMGIDRETLNAMREVAEGRD